MRSNYSTKWTGRAKGVRSHDRSLLARSVPLAAATVLGGATLASAATGTWNANAAGNWSDETKWVGGTISDIANGATFTANFVAPLTASRIITLDGPRTIGHLSFSDTDTATAHAFTISGGNTLTLNADGSGGGTSVINVATGTSATIGGSSLVLAGSSNINKTGVGSLTLSTSNALGSGGPDLRAFTGTLSITAGNLRLGAANPLAGVATTLGGGAENVTLSFAGGISDGATYNIGSTTVASGGAGTVTFDYNGSGNRNIIGGGVTLNKTVTFSVNPGVLQFNNAISGVGGIIKTGGGGLQFNAGNSFNGGIELRQGFIRLVSAGGLGAGTLTIGSATTGGELLLGSNGGTTSNNIHVVTGTGTVTINSLGAEGSDGSKTLSGDILIDRNITLSSTNRNAANAIVTASGAISGAGAISTSSHANNRVQLTGNNAYTGGTTIVQGTLRTGNANALGTGQVAFHATNTATLELNNTALGVHSLSGGSAATSIVTGGTSGILTLTSANASPASFAGVISGAGSVVKNGSGTQILTGSNSYTGTTTLNAGTLSLGSTGSIAAGSAVAVKNTATLAGTGTINGTVTVEGGGTLSPGNSPGLQNVGSLVLNDGGNYNWQILNAAGAVGTGYDSYNLTGALNLASLTGTTDFNINLWSLSDTGPDVNGNASNFVNTQDYVWTLIATPSAISNFDGSKFTVNVAAANGAGGFTNTLNVNGSFSVALSDDNTDLVLKYTVVPEPGMMGLLGLLGTGLLRRRRAVQMA